MEVAGYLWMAISIRGAREILPKGAQLVTLADLGYDVLDMAMIEAAACV
jgi:hypothetical protein